MNHCLCCTGSEFTLLWSISKIPAFQNRVYDSFEEARATPRVQVRLVQCQNCGFVFNQAFDPGIMVYDGDYQNEQAHSAYFQEHLNTVLGFLKSRVPPPSKVVEVGCGKGFFLGELAKQGYQVTGYDPAYEGDNPAVAKQYFGPGLGGGTPAALVVLRHTLEHVPDPLNMLQLIAEGNGCSGLIYVEVPCFDWIVERKAFWDIFHEHNSYFTAHTLAGLFGSYELRRTFGGQYISLLADLATLRPRPRKRPIPKVEPLFTTELYRWGNFVKAHSGLVVWGAGAKGAAFANAIDPDSQTISVVVDINPAKQNKFIAGTGHRIVSPEDVDRLRNRTIIVMNDNYIEEVVAMTQDLGVTLYTLGTV